jgi:phosphonoacetate hydrolase
VVTCLDGSSFEYLFHAVAAGVAPFLGSLLKNGFARTAESAIPSFTNPNNLSIVTGVPPSRHGIAGNFFLDRETNRAVMMNDSCFLRAETIPAAFARAGAKVVVITAKEKLRRLLGAGLDGLCLSAENEGQPVYSSVLSEYVLRRGAELMGSTAPELMYLSTSDYVQHLFPPGSPEANQFYAVIDEQLADLDRSGATIVITADHGMSAKTDTDGRPRILFLQQLLDAWLGRGSTRVILPITDPYVAHHGSLGSFACIYLEDHSYMMEIVSRLSSLPGVDLVLEHDTACRQFELPEDRTGDIVVCANRETVLGTHPHEHDLSVLRSPLRSHGGLAEREVPMLFNRPIRLDSHVTRLKNYDAFWLALNCTDDSKSDSVRLAGSKEGKGSRDEHLIEQQLGYYRARALEYDQWFLRQGRYDRGAKHRAEWFNEIATIERTLAPIAEGKEVLELACGTGLWTERLSKSCVRILAVDAAPEMLSINQQRLQSHKVEYRVADIFSWTPTPVADVVFFSFWLSHVPPTRFEEFWHTVLRALKPGGVAFFIDSLFEPTSTARDHSPIDNSGVARRKLNDGREFKIVKMFYDPSGLQHRLNESGWKGWVRSSGKFFLYGLMTRPEKN